MKRILLIAALVLLTASITEAALTYEDTYYEKWVMYAATGTDRDPIRLFINEVEGILEGTSGFSAGITLENSATITNTPDNDIILTENSETLKFRFSNNNVELLTGSGVTSLDVNDLYITFNEISAPSGDPSSDQGWLYVKDDTGTTTLYFEDSAGTVTDLLTVGSGNTLDQAYDQGGAGSGAKIDADTGPVEIEVDDASTGSGGNYNGLHIDYDDVTNDGTPLIIESAVDAADAPAIDIDAQTTGRDVEGTGASWYVSGAGAMTVDTITTSTAGYISALASASSGNVNLTVDAAGSGTITLGGTSTGKITTDNEMELTGDMDFSGTVISSVTLDDGVTDSPTFTLQDATNETAAFVKKDNGDTEVTIPADTDFEIVTGNLAVGNGSPGTAAMDGEDFYVNGASEFDGAVQFDGLPTFAAGVDIDEDVDIDFDASDEEVDITNSAEYGADAAQVTINNTDADVTAAMYLLRLRYTDDGQANADYLVLEDNAGDDKVVFGEGGYTAWSLDAAEFLFVDATSTANTSTTGVIDLDVESATNTNSAVSLTYELEDGATTAYGIDIDVDDDATGGETFNALNVSNDNGTSSTTQGLVIENTVDVGINQTLGASAQAMVIDASSTINTGTSGVIDTQAILSEDTAAFANLDIESEADGAGEIVHGVFMTLDDDADNADNELRGIHIETDGSAGTGIYEAIHVEGANMDAAFQADTGYVRIGTGSTADVTPGDDDLYVEGTTEIDGDVRLDGLVYYPPATESFTTEGDITATLTSRVVLLEGDNDADNDTIDLQDGSYAGQIVTFVAHANIDADDTCTFNFGDTTATNAPAVAFNKLGENVTLVWTGATIGWSVIGLQSSL